MSHALPLPFPAPQPDPQPAAATAAIPTAAAAWWRHVFIEAGHPQFICSATGTILESNRQAAATLGLAPGHQLEAVPSFPAETRARLAEALALPEPPSEPLTLDVVPSTPATPDSPQAQAGPRVLDFRITPLGDGSHLVQGKDATRRLRRECHTQRLLAAIDSTPDVVLLTDADYRITFANPAFVAATGLVLDEVLHQPVECVHAAGQEDTIREYKEGARRGADWVGELVMRRRDGSTYPVDMSFSPVRDRDGQFIGAVAFQRDISGRKRLQEALLAERNFARSIINSLDACLYTLDGRFRLTHFNEGWRRQPGEHGWLCFPDAPQVGRSLLEYVVDDTRRSQLEQAFREVLAEGQPRELQAADASGRHWIMSVFPWHHQGQIRGLIYRVTDNSALAGAQQQLLQAQKMSTVGALVAGVAHDFNNLLLAIRGNVSLVTMDPKVPIEARARLQQVDEATVRATDLARQLTTIARPSEEHVTILDFNEIIRETGQIARHVARGRIKLALQPTPEPVKVQLDPTQAVQVLLNLVINAADAMPKGGSITITNSLPDLTPAQRSRTRHRPEVQFMRCSVSDTGSGIPPEVLPKIFTTFFTTKPPGKGTGLGLAIVSSVVHRAGGFIEVESTVGTGTTFHIYLPIEVGPLTRTDTEIRRQICRGSGRLLVVDDLDLVLEFAANFLRQAGYQVLTANSADAALKVLAQQKLPVDLLFTDYTMPGKNGWQLIQEVSARWPLTRCVLASGYIDDEERAEILKAQQVRLLAKPYGIPEATALIADCLGHPQPGQESHSHPPGPPVSGDSRRHGSEPPSK